MIVGGEDPILWTDLGFAVGAELTDNRFSEVETPMNHQPQSDGTEQGTLLAPFPEPDLKIETAIRLSWPSFHEGWSVQSTLDLENWTLLGLPVQHGGQSVLTVPAGERFQSFRLVYESDSQ